MAVMMMNTQNNNEQTLPSKRNEAYVTMITSDDFCQGVEALLGSINSNQVKEKRPILVMYTANVSKRVQDKIKKAGQSLSAYALCC
jgi:hypothetical protein